MIQVEDLSLSFGEQVVFENVFASLQKGERCGLIGRNGSGKSTFFRLLTGEEKPDQGRVILPKGYRLGVLQQQIRFTQATVLQEGALGLAEGEKEALYQVESLLFGLGFSEADMDRSPHDFSGGYQLRIQLAKVLVSKPDCLLLDEPTNYLDILSIRFLSRFLKSWKGEMILISHDLQFLDEVTTHMMGVHRQKILKLQGKSDDLFGWIAKEEERHEAVRQNLEKKKAHLQSFIDRFGAKATKAAQAQARQKQIEKMPHLEKLKSLNQLDFSFQEVPFFGKKMLEATQLSFRYDPHKPLIDEASLTIEKGDRIAIIGKNGRGKSTFLKLLTQELKPQKGEVILSAAAKIGYFGQTSIQRLSPELTIEEEISSANSNLNLGQVRSICGVMLFSGDLAKKPISVLSGGEKSRVLLGKILAHPCNLLFLDEPTHHLDIESIEALIDAIETFQGAVVLVTHSEWVLRRIAFQKLIVCHPQKQEVFLGSYDEFLEKVGWQEEKVEAVKKTVAKEEKKPQVSKNTVREIQKCEEAIMALEQQLEAHHAELALLYETGAVQQIAPLLQLIEQKKGKIDALFEQLERLSSK